MKDNLEKMRQKIDEIDRELIKNLSRRFVITDMVGKYKRENGIAIRDSEREEAMIRQRKEWSENEQTDCELVESIFRKIFEKVVQKNERR